MKPYLSLVIPVLDEEESLDELVSEIKKNMLWLNKPYEIIFIDDGSTDNTLSLLKKLEKTHAEIKVYSFRKNQGKANALTLGFQKAKSPYIITLDADLQDDPKNIEKMYKTITENEYDVVAGWRKDRRDSVTKILSSKLFNNIVVPLLFNLKIHDLNCGLKMYRADVAKELNLYGGMHRFIPILAHEMGYRVTELPVIHHPRKFGKSKYKFTKIITDIPDLATIYFLTKYTSQPLHFFGKIGIFVFSIGFVVLAYLAGLHFMGESIGTRPLLLFGVLLVIMGVQTIFTGLIADLVVNMNQKNETQFSLKYESDK